MRVEEKTVWERVYGVKVEVLTSGGWESAEWLARAIGARTSYVGSSADVVIRYGNRKPVSSDSVVINNIEAVRLCVDREAFARRMKECGVKTPYIMSIVDKLRYRRKYPKYVYLNGSSQAGSGVVIVQSKSDEEFLKSRGYEYVESRWVSVDREYRVHLIDNGEEYKWLLQLKLPTRLSQMMFFIRNRALTGYEFRRVNDTKVGHEERRVVMEAMKAVRAIGIDFCAVDVVVSGKKVYVLDVNSAPGILRYPYLRNFYKKHIVERVEYEIGVE